MSKRTDSEEDRIGPIHPGEILQIDFLDGYGLTRRQFADAIRMPLQHVTEITEGKGHYG